MQMKRVYRATWMFWKCLGTNTPKRVTPNTENTCRRDGRPAADFTHGPGTQHVQRSCQGNHREAGLSSSHPQSRLLSAPDTPYPQRPRGLFRKRGAAGGRGGHWPAWRRGWGPWCWPCRAPTAGWREWSGPEAPPPCTSAADEAPCGRASQGAPRPFPTPPPPSPHLQPSPPLPPGIQTGPFFTRVPNLPEGVGDSDGTEFSNEKPQEQDKDDKEVEDVPAVLGGWASPSRVCQAQPVGSSWVCPPHTSGWGTPRCSRSRASHVPSTAVLLSAPKHATKHLRARCLIHVSTAKRSVWTHSRAPHTRQFLSWLLPTLANVPLTKALPCS